MVWTPYTSDTLVRTEDLVRFYPLVPLSTGLHQECSLFQDLLLLEISNTDRPLSSIDVVTLDDGVLRRPGRYPNLDRWVLLGDLGEEWRL